MASDTGTKQVYMERIEKTLYDTQELLVEYD